MAAFADSQGKQWFLRLTVGDLPVLRELNASPDDLLKNELKGLFDLLGNAERVVSVVYALAHTDTPPEQFATLFDGDTLERATSALLDTITDFIPSARREPLRALGKKLEAVGAEMASRALAEVESLNPVSVCESIVSASLGKSDAIPPG